MTVILSEVAMERSRTGGDHWVLSVIFQAAVARVNQFGNETADEIYSYVAEKIKPVGDGVALMRSISREVSALGWDSGKVEAFNSRWRVHCFREALQRMDMRDKVSYDEALQALREHFVVEPVLNS